MTPDRVRVDLDQLDNLVAQLDNLAGFIADQLEALDQKTTAVHTGGAWDGAAATAHKTAHDAWMTAAKEFTDGIGEMRTAARTAHTAYSGLIDANVRMFRK